MSPADRYLAATLEGLIASSCELGCRADRVALGPKAAQARLRRLFPTHRTARLWWQRWYEVPGGFRVFDGYSAAAETQGFLEDDTLELGCRAPNHVVRGPALYVPPQRLEADMIDLYIAMRTDGWRSSTAAEIAARCTRNDNVTPPYRSARATTAR